MANGNSAENGGVVYQLLGSLTIIDSIFTRNMAYKIGVLNVEGHTVLINGSTFGYDQGMIFLSRVEFFNISSTKIIHNSVSTKGILYVRDSDIEGYGELIIKDNTANLSIVNIVRCNVTFRHMISYVIKLGIIYCDK